MQELEKVMDGQITMCNHVRGQTSGKMAAANLGNYGEFFFLLEKEMHVTSRDFVCTTFDALELRTFSHYLQDL